MKTVSAAFACICAIVVLCSSASVFLSSDASADANPFDGYYRAQLTPDQADLYDLMVAIGTGAPAHDERGYYISVATSYTGSDLLKDATIAWQATKLDATKEMNWAFWTWTLDDVKSSVTVESTNIRIAVAEKFKDGFDAAIAAVNAAIDAVEIKGDTPAKKVQSINSILTSSPYTFVDSAKDHDCANTIYAVAPANIGEDKKVYMTSFAYSVLFKALCAKADIPCIQIYGWYGNGPVAAAWNEVLLEGHAYGVNAAVNSTAANKSAWLAAGIYTEYDGQVFGKIHNDFVKDTVNGFDYSAFRAESIPNDGYSMPADRNILTILYDNASWILIGLICVVLAVVLVQIARKGDL